MPTLVRIVEADTPVLIGAARGLFREYAASLSFSLDYQGFEEELASLPGKYSRPQGRLLLAFFGEELAGSVALRSDRRGSFRRTAAFGGPRDPYRPQSASP